jgi:hypothetical protein
LRHYLKNDKIIICLMHRKQHLKYSFGIIFFFLSLFASLSSYAQNGANPFDIGRPAITIDSSNTTTTNTTKTTISDNPFDIIVSTIPATNTTQNIKKEVLVPPTPTTAAKPQRFLFGLVLSILLLLTVLVSLSRNLLSKIYQAFFNDIVLKALHRERSSLNTTVYVSLYSMFIINLGVFIYLVLRHYNFLFYNSDLITLFYCVLGIGGLIIAKHLVLSILSYIFPLSKEIDTYSFIIVIFGVLIGLILAPINVFFAYSDPKMGKYIVLGTAFFLVLIYCLCALRSLFLARNYIFPHFFHFLLYLCSVEIIPLLLLYKIINKNI